MKKIILLSILTLIVCCKKADDNQLEDNIKQNISTEEFVPQTLAAEVELPEYSLIKKDDISIKTSMEPNAAVNKRFTFKYLVPNTIKEEQIAPLVKKLLEDIVKSDNDIDDVTVWLYSDEKLIDGSYNVGMGSFSPSNGEVTKGIALSNDRSSYIAKYLIADNFGERFKNESEKVVISGLSYDLRKKIYQELANTESRAREKLDKIYPYTANFDTKNFANKLDELTKKYEKEISKKYKIDDNTVKSIYDEGDKNEWYNL